MATSAKTAPSPGPILDVNYLSLRKSIGWIAILMPWVVRAVASIDGGAPFLMSISAYYNTSGRDVFVGSLFATGLFLSFYRGDLNSKQDHILAVIWGIATASIGLINRQPYHLILVTLFFAISLYMVLFRFTKPSQHPVTPEKLRRNKFYIAFGVVMLASVLAIAYLNQIGSSIFVPEAIAIAFLGAAWLVKGQMFLADKVSPRAAS